MAIALPTIVMSARVRPKSCVTQPLRSDRAFLPSDVRPASDPFLLVRSPSGTKNETQAERIDRSRDTLAGIGPVELRSEHTPMQDTQPSPSAPVPARPASKPPSSPIDLSRPREYLLDAMRKLQSLRTELQGGRHCLYELSRAIPARAGLLHLFDASKGHFECVLTTGARAERFLRSTIPQDDNLTHATILHGRPLKWDYTKEGRNTPPKRHAFFIGPRSAIIAPVMVDRRCLALLELVDPGEHAQADEVLKAVSYVALRYAAFLGSDRLAKPSSEKTRRTA